MPMIVQNPAADEPLVPVSSDDSRAEQEKRPKEHGGREGPEPTRYGDWEKNGRCIDF
jgi:hypothetical protein